MRNIRSIAALSLTLALATSAGAGPLHPDHPLVGTWKITLPGMACFETYSVNANGTSFVTSAEQVSQSSFEISAEPSERGFYKWVDTIVKDNGKKDCSGETLVIGHIATNFIRLHPSGNMFLMCEEEKLDACIGPFVRQSLKDI
jgi:hypothetical protein